jgi:hypothetical protein
MWLYQTVDKTDKALGGAALANKVGERIPLLVQLGANKQTILVGE